MSLTVNPCPFLDMVGQNRLKKSLKFFYDGYQSTNIVPNLLFTGARGQGKTAFAAEFAKSLKNPLTGKAKKRIEVNSGSIKSIDYFFEKIVIPHIANGDGFCSVILDESQLLPEPVTGCLLTILNPSKTNKTHYSHQDYDVEFDSTKVTFILATSEPHKIFKPLQNRLEVLSLEDYTLSDIVSIINIGLENKFVIEDSIKDDLASVIRGSAREACRMANKIKNFLVSKNSNTLTADLWAEFKDCLSILPLGLSSTEISILEHLACGGSMTLTCLAAKMNLSTAALRGDAELYLLKNSLLKIDVNGRGITAKGLNLLAKTRGATII